MSQNRRVRLQLVTVFEKIGEGVYATLPSRLYRDKGYEETRLVKFLPDEPGYPAPGAIQVEAVVDYDIFLNLDNAQSGGEAEGEVYNRVAIVDGSAVDVHTGKPVDPTQV